MLKLAVNDSIRMVVFTNLLIVVIVLTLEKFSVGAHIFTLLKESRATQLSAFLYENGKSFSRTFVLVPIIFLILIQNDLRHYQQLYLKTFRSNSYYFLVAQVICFALFYYLTELALGSAENRLILQFLWVCLGFLVAILTILSVANIVFLKQLVLEQKLKWIIALGSSVGVWWLSLSTQTLWQPFGDITFFLVADCLHWFDDSVYLNVEERTIGINGFMVLIAPECSGYEGVGLITAFLAIVLYSFRKDFQFPRAFLLFPLGAIAIWLFNIARITLLILIGGYWSPDVAVQGFHTQAGWIAFIATSFALVYLAHNSSFFSVKIKAKKQSIFGQINLPIATVLPLIALLMMTLITQAFSAEIDLLYPLRVIVVGAVIFLCLKHLDIYPLKAGYFSLAAGLVVALVWLVLVDVDLVRDDRIARSFAESNQVVVTLWLIFRFLGAVVTVPIAEELGFRAYLLCSASSQKVITRGAIPFSFVGLIVSSLAFGLLHGAWLAGVSAGVIYALVRYRSTHIADAIIAHSMTNCVLFVYVLYSGHWSLL